MPVEGCPDTARQPCPVTIPGVMEWRQGEPSLRRAGRSSLMPSSIPHPLGRVGCTACTVSMSGGPVDRACVACGRTGRRVQMNGSWLDRHACCTEQRSWCARLGSWYCADPAGPQTGGLHVSLSGGSATRLTGPWRLASSRAPCGLCWSAPNGMLG